MAQERVQRRLTTILAADVVGYSRLMEQDEAGTMAILKARRKEVLEGCRLLLRPPHTHIDIHGIRCSQRSDPGTEPTCRRRQFGIRHALRTKTAIISAA